MSKANQFVVPQTDSRSLYNRNASERSSAVDIETRSSGFLVDEALKAKKESFRASSSNSRASISEQRRSLPIYSQKLELGYLIEHHQITFVTGPPGVGKSSQIAQYLHELRWTSSRKAIAVTQPSKSAVLELSSRLASEVGCEVGTEVGSMVRFDTVIEPFRTRIVVMTEGMLLREAFRDPLLGAYSVVILDEVQFASWELEIVFGLMISVTQARSDLRLVIVSDDEESIGGVMKYLSGHLSPPKKSRFEHTAMTDQYNLPALLTLEDGSASPEIFTLSHPVRDIVTAAAAAVLSLDSTLPSTWGIVVLLPSSSHTTSLNDSLIEMRSRPRSRPLCVSCSPWGVFGRPWSFSVPSFVLIDAGQVQISISGQISPVPIPLSSLRSRSRGASRTYWLFSSLNLLPLTPASPISLLCPTSPNELPFVLLTLMGCGIQLSKFPWKEPPSARSINISLGILRVLGFVDGAGLLTPLGAAMSRSNAPENLSWACALSGASGCGVAGVKEAVARMAALSLVSLGGGVKKWGVREGDALTSLNALEEWLSQSRTSRMGWARARGLHPSALSRAWGVSKSYLSWVSSLPATALGQPLSLLDREEIEASLGSKKPRESLESFLSRKYIARGFCFDSFLPLPSGLYSPLLPPTTPGVVMGKASLVPPSVLSSSPPPRTIVDLVGTPRGIGGGWNLSSVCVVEREEIDKMLIRDPGSCGGEEKRMRMQ